MEKIKDLKKNLEETKNENRELNEELDTLIGNMEEINNNKEERERREGELKEMFTQRIEQ